MNNSETCCKYTKKNEQICLHSNFLPYFLKTSNHYEKSFNKK